MTVKQATAIGFTAILMWATMPAIASKLSGIPAFQINAMALGTAFLLTLLKWALSKNGLRQELSSNFSIPVKIWLLGIFGIFGFHLFYFLAYRHTQAIMAAMVVNLWPLMTIMLSSLVLRYPLHANHILAGLMGLSGVGYISYARFAGEQAHFAMEHLLGMAEAFIAGIIWALYSVLSRKYQADMKRDSVGVFCGISALLCWICHFALENSVMLSAQQWLLIIYLGCAPMGLAFFTWDYGMKYGNVRSLGILSYIGPLVGITLLILLGFAEFSSSVLIAGALVIGGAVIGTHNRKTAAIAAKN